MTSSHKTSFAILVVPDGLCAVDSQRTSGSKQDCHALDSQYDSSGHLSTRKSESLDSDASRSRLVSSNRCWERNNLQCLADEPLCTLPLPVGRKSLLLLNLRHLRRSGVQSIVVLVQKTYGTCVQRHLIACGGKKWSSTQVVSVESKTLVEALREARQKELSELHNEFYLMMADVFLSDAQTLLKNLADSHTNALQTDSCRLFTRVLAEVPSTEKECCLPYTQTSILRAFSCGYPFMDNVFVVNTLTTKIVAASSCDTNASYLPLTHTALDTMKHSGSLSLFSNVITCGIDFMSVNIFNLIEDQFDLVDLDEHVFQSIISDELQLHSVGAFIVPPHPSNLYPSVFRVTSSSLLLLMQSILASASSPSRQDAMLTHSYVGRNVTLEAGTLLEHCVVFDHVTLGQGGHYQYCIFLPGCTTPPEAVFRHCIIESSMDKDLFTSLTLQNTRITRGEGSSLSQSTCSVLLDSSLVIPLHSVPRMRVEDFLWEAENNSSEDTETQSRADTTSDDSDVDLEARPATGSHQDIGSSHGSPSSFCNEIFSLAIESLQKPSVLEYKLHEMRAFRIACDEKQEACIHPCAHAFMDYLISQYHESGCISTDIIEACAGDELLSFFIEDTVADQRLLLSALLHYAFSRQSVDMVNSSRDHSDASTCTTGVKPLPNPFCEPSRFCTLLECLRQLDVFSDNVLIDWCSSLPQSFLYAQDIHLFAKALQNYSGIQCGHVE